MSTISRAAVLAILSGLGLSLAGACGSSSASGGGSGSSSGGSEGGGDVTMGGACTPGQQVSCACPGSSVTGAQTCNAGGSGYGTCTGCPSGGSSGSDGGSSGGSGSGSGGPDAGDAAIDGAASDAADACAPRSCAQQMLDCGMATDGCGTAINCGTCPSGQICGATTPNVCGACTPRSCAQQMLDCGMATDGCGNAIDCGTCPAGQVCGASTPNVCGTCPSGDIICLDGCQNTSTSITDCGMCSHACASGQSCINGQCQ